MEEVPGDFLRQEGEGRQREGELVAELYRQIGQLKVELDWLKKNLRFSAKEKRTLIEPGYSEIPAYRQCELLELSRAGYYYRPREVSALNLALMRLIDEQYTSTPFYGVEKMTAWLKAAEL